MPTPEAPPALLQALRDDFFVDVQKVAEELEQPTAQDLLKDASLARLAYNGPDGMPRVIPIGFFWNGDEIVICTAVTSPKVRALSDRPDVALTIDVGDTGHGESAFDSRKCIRRDRRWCAF